MKNITTELFHTSAFRVEDKNLFFENEFISQIIKKMDDYGLTSNYADNYVALVMTPEMFASGSFDIAINAMAVIEEMIHPADTCKAIVLSSQANTLASGTDYYSCLIRRGVQKHYMDRCDSNAISGGWGYWTGEFASMEEETANA